MKIVVGKHKNVLFKAYNAYRNYTPINVMTPNETIIFNSIVMALATGVLYWALFVLPQWLAFLSERAIYYLTGQTISISLVCSLAVRRLIYSSKPSGPRSNMSHEMAADFYHKR